MHVHNLFVSILYLCRTEYTSFGVVTEFLYAMGVSNIFGGQNNISELLELGPERGFLQSDDALVFVMIVNFQTREGYLSNNN